MDVLKANPEYILYGVLAFAWMEFAWECYLGMRQRKVYRENTKPPKELKDITDEETFEKARLYALDKSKFGAIQGVFGQALSTIIIWFCAYVWDQAKLINQSLLGSGYDSEIYRYYIERC